MLSIVSVDFGDFTNRNKIVMFLVAMLMFFRLFCLFPLVFFLQFVAVDENSCGVYHAKKAE